MVWENRVRYVLIATAAFLVGANINIVIRIRAGWEPLNDPTFNLIGFLWLVSMYATFHMVASSVVKIVSLICSIRVRSILYLLLSIIGLSASIYLMNPIKIRSTDLFTLCWGSLVLVSLDYAWRVKRRQRDEGLSSA